MASVYPAMKGQFGSHEYFMVTMKAGDVANQLVIPKEMPDWEDMDLVERFQREINYTRVKKHIAPYLAHDEDRFFGALIVDVLNPEGMEFEPGSKVLAEAPKLYESAAKSFGFLTLSGSEMLVPLDGQHRLAAIKFALTGKDEKQKEISGLASSTDLANDDVLLILVKHDTVRARKIFNKVNRYAKATSKAENLITADDDIIAVLSRDLVADTLIGSDVVSYKGNTLPDRSTYFTTLSTIYDTSKKILEEYHGKVDDQTLPDKATQGLYRRTLEDVWGNLLGGVSIFKTALQDIAETKGTTESGNDKRVEIRRELLLGKPFAQQALVIAVLRLFAGETTKGAKLSWDEVLKRINSLDWGVKNSLWQGVLLDGTRIKSGRQNLMYAGRFIAYYLGANLDEKELGQLTELYQASFPGEGKDLPPPKHEP